MVTSMILRRNMVPMWLDTLMGLVGMTPPYYRYRVYRKLSAPGGVEIILGFCVNERCFGFFLYKVEFQ